MKSGFVALIGRPNAGKSTLLNRLVGQKLAIVSDKPQTTRHRVVGVRNTDAGQMVFIDTPGIHKPQHRMNVRMLEAAKSAIHDVDVVVLMIDASVPPGAGDRFVLDMFENVPTPTILVLNKVDAIKKTTLLPLIESYAHALSFKAVVPISAVTGEGVDGLEREMLAALPEGEPLYDADYLTDQTDRTLVAELIREKVLIHTRDELPHATAVVIDQFEEPEEGSKLHRIYASILVDHDSQKAIIVGKAGSMIKRIGTDARMDIQELLGGKIYLDLHVKVRENWREDERMLDQLGVPPRK